MKISTRPVERLTSEQVYAWRCLAEQTALDSPFFQPEFTAEVAAVRSDVEVAVLEAAGEPLGFFPYQRGRGNVAAPVGGILNDFHGLILGPGASVDAFHLLRQCGLAAWEFHHLVAGQEAFQPYCWLESDSPYIDVSAGYEAYCKERHAAGSNIVSGTMQKFRKAVREIGPVRFEPHSTDPELFQTLLAWKTRHYHAIGSIDYLAPAWTVALLDRLRQRSGEELQGMLSAVYFGDQLAAVHLGLRSRHVLHCWFPAYNEALAKYSPGVILFLEMARAAADLGIRRLDLGRGSERFKTSLQSGAARVGQGAVDLRRAVSSLRRTWFHAREWVRSSRLRRPARFVVRQARAVFSFLGETRHGVASHKE